MHTNVQAQPIVVVPVDTSIDLSRSIADAIVYQEFCGNIAMHMPLISLFAVDDVVALEKLTRIRHKINTLCSLVSDVSNHSVDETFLLEAQKQVANKIRQCVEELYVEVMDGYDIFGRRTISDCEFQIGLFFDNQIHFKRFQGESTRFTLDAVMKHTVEQLQSFQVLYDVIVGNVTR